MVFDKLSTKKIGYRSQMLCHYCFIGRTIFRFNHCTEHREKTRENSDGRYPTYGNGRCEIIRVTASEVKLGRGTDSPQQVTIVGQASSSCEVPIYTRNFYTENTISFVLPFHSIMPQEDRSSVFDLSLNEAMKLNQLLTKIDLVEINYIQHHCEFI